MVAALERTPRRRPSRLDPAGVEITRRIRQWMDYRDRVGQDAMVAAVREEVAIHNGTLPRRLVELSTPFTRYADRLLAELLA